MADGGSINIELRPQRLTVEDRQLHPWVEPGEYACLTVADSGKGMDQGTLDHIFEPFYTTKPRGEGTGLGMAMVYGLVKQHAGYIHLYSEPGSGTVVRTYFPLASEDAVDTSDPPSAAALPRGAETILWVEDDGHLLRSAARLLANHGYRLLTASDGVSTLETFRAHEAEIDLVVTDMVMPRMGGRQLFEALRAEGKTVPVLFMSGYSGGVLGDIIAAYGQVPFLGKPWTAEGLLSTVRQVIDETQPALATVAGHTRQELGR